jgi:hypothetical protein
MYSERAGTATGLKFNVSRAARCASFPMAILMEAMVVVLLGPAVLPRVETIERAQKVGSVERRDRGKRCKGEEDDLGT